MSASEAKDPIVLSGKGLTLGDVLEVARQGRELRIDPVLMARLAATKEHIAAHWMTEAAPLIYSLNTGVGSFKDQRVDVADIEAYQKNMILSHATGLGTPFAEDVVRAMLLLRLNAFSADVSGISPVLAERFVDFLNAGLTPVVPSKGSVGPIATAATKSSQLPLNTNVCWKAHRQWLTKVWRSPSCLCRQMA